LLLKIQGYTVLQAVQPSQALEVCSSFPSTIHLYADESANAGRHGRPPTGRGCEGDQAGDRTLLMSGYTTDSIVLHGVAEGAPFLQKAFTQQQVAAKLREVLDDAVPFRQKDNVALPA
jgi:hypothetical protein